MTKKLKDIIFKVILVIFTLGIIALIIWFIIYYFIIPINEMIIDFVDLGKSFIKDPITTTKILLLVLAIIVPLLLIINYWNRRDDFFNFLVHMFCSPYDYFYKKKKKKLLIYRDEIKKLLSYTKHFSNMDLGQILQNEFWIFVEEVLKENERLEKNRKILESKDMRINLWIELFFLVCGVVVALFM